MTSQEVYKIATKNGLAKRLYDWIEHEYSEDEVRGDIDHDYLTINEGRDDKDYLVYLDESACAAICIDSGRIVGVDECDRLFF